MISGAATRRSTRGAVRSASTGHGGGRVLCGEGRACRRAQADPGNSRRTRRCTAGRPSCSRRTRAERRFAAIVRAVGDEHRPGQLPEAVPGVVLKGMSRRRSRPSGWASPRRKRRRRIRADGCPAGTARRSPALRASGVSRCARRARRRARSAPTIRRAEWTRRHRRMAKPQPTETRDARTRRTRRRGPTAIASGTVERRLSPRERGNDRYRLKNDGTTAVTAPGRSRGWPDPPVLRPPCR